MEPPSKTIREKCWKSRDEYFKCLDANGLWLDGLKPRTHQEIIDIQPSKLDFKIDKKLNACSQLKELYRKGCLPSWFVHFQVLRLQDLQKQHLLKRMESAEQDRQSDDYWKSVQSK